MFANFYEPAFEWSGFTHLKAVLHNSLYSGIHTATLTEG